MAFWMRSISFRTSWLKALHSFIGELGYLPADLALSLRSHTLTWFSQGHHGELHNLHELHLLERVIIKGLGLLLPVVIELVHYVLRRLC